MWLLWVVLVIAGAFASYRMSVYNHNKQLPSRILGPWQGRNSDQTFCFYPDGTCSATVKGPNGTFGIIDGLYIISRNKMTLSLANRVMTRYKVFINENMLVMTPLQSRQKEIFDRMP